MNEKELFKPTGDKKIDGIIGFDYCNKSAYLSGKISKEDFLLIESIWKFVFSLKQCLSPNAQKELKEILYNIL